MSFFNYSSVGLRRRSDGFSRAGGLRLGVAVVALVSLVSLISLISLVSLAGPTPVSHADGTPAESLNPVSEPTKTGSTVVYGVSASPRATKPARRSGFAASPEVYLGMTRTSARQRIERIDPASWLANFGDVRAVAIR